MLTFSFDLHGVIDTDPEFFSKLFKKLMDRHNMIYIITGSEITPELEKYFYDNNISYSGVYSITSLHLSLGTPMKFIDGDRKKPLIDSDIWNRTKSTLCEILDVDYHIDDSKIYGKYFKSKKIKYLIYPSSKTFKFLVNLLS